MFWIRVHKGVADPDPDAIYYKLWPEWLEVSEQRELKAYNGQVVNITRLLKGHGNEADFLGFLQKLVPHESLILPFGPFRFWLRIRGDIRVRNTTPRYHRYGESPTPCIVESGSRRLPAALIGGVGDYPHHRYGESAIEFFKRKLSVSMIRRVVDSPHQWYGESPTPRIVELKSRRLGVSPIRRVDDSVYRCVGESTTPRIGDTGSRYSKKS